MRSVKTVLFYTLIGCFINKATAQYITVDDSKTAQELVQNILVNSPCAKVSNFTVSGNSYSSGQNSYGYFNSGASGFPFSEGILLSTWNADNSVGPFVTTEGGGSKSWVGDPDLEQALGLTKTINATALEFDFIPLTNFLSFNYIFASNEYQIYFPCVYSDGFAFLIKEKGSSDNYTNLAVLPGTTTPVSSENVHPIIKPYTDNNGNNYSGCPPINESYFNGFNTLTSPINYAGQTKVMTAQTNVIAGKTYHIKLVIADDANEYYDSAVFLQAGSFAQKIDLGADRTSSSSNPICYGETLFIDTKLPSTYTYKWFKNNIELIGQTNSSYTITDSGTYRVEATLTPTTCVAIGEIKVEYAPEIKLNNTFLTQCDDNGDGISVFNLTKADNIIKNNDASLSSIVYYPTLAEARTQTNAITNPASYPNTMTDQIVFARVANIYGCVEFAEVKLQISNNTIAPQKPITICEDRLTGYTYSDLNSTVTPQVLNGLPAGLIVEYYSTLNDAVLQKNPLPNDYGYITEVNRPTIYARIINGTDCYGIIPVPFFMVSFFPSNFQDETLVLCDGKTVNLGVSTGFNSYLWNTGATTNTIVAANADIYTVTVTNEYGCEALKTFTTIPSEIAAITGATINDFAGNENSVSLQYIGTGNYEFSLDGSYFQPDPLFKNVAPGTYLAYANDKNGCGISPPYPVYILDYPRYFSPNGDGYNDSWKIKNLSLLPQSTITIFDRYGKLLKQLSTPESEWNGTFNNHLLPADDYWFNVTFQDGRIIKGHFSLKR